MLLRAALAQPLASLPAALHGDLDSAAKRARSSREEAELKD